MRLIVSIRLSVGVAQQPTPLLMETEFQELVSIRLSVGVAQQLSMGRWG